MDYQKLANLLYKNIHTTPEYYYEKLQEGDACRADVHIGYCYLMQTRR